MSFDDLIAGLFLFFVNYGYFLVIFFCLLKILLLLWFREWDFLFMLQNFFYLKYSMIYSSDIPLGRRRNFFFDSYNVISFLKYASLIGWVIAIFLYRRISG